jgi:aspartyl-tRNA(Asn)/glutamyl-tRNA(Gln) amidotransferase subunit A
MSADLCSLTITELSRQVRSRKLSCVELTRAYLERIATYQPKLDAFITVTANLRFARPGGQTGRSLQAITAGQCTACRSA